MWILTGGAFCSAVKAFHFFFLLLGGGKVTLDVILTLAKESWHQLLVIHEDL